MRFVNCTPHVVRVLAAGSNTELVLELPPSGHRPQVQQEMGEVISLGGVPFRSCDRGGVAGLPPEQDGVVLIVASMIRDACPDRRDLVSPDTSAIGAVRDAAGQPWATRWLIR